MSDPAVSVVIPTFQRCASVRRALRSLGRQTLPADAYEVIVSVDGSDDGTVEMLASERADARLRAIRQAHRGRAAARNAGACAARGTILVFLDDDMEASPGLLAAHLAAHQAGDLPAGRAVVGAAPIVSDASSPLTAYLARAFQERLDTLARPDRPVGFHEAYTGNLSVERSTLLQLGGFDESFRLYGHEDYEFALRLAAAGVRLEFCPEALATQHQEKSFRDVARDTMARGRTAVQFARKHPEAMGALKLGRFDAETRKWRLLRSALLRLTGAFDRTPELVIDLVSRLEARRPRRLDRYYTMALDYCYWAGVQAARREDAPADTEPRT